MKISSVVLEICGISIEKIKLLENAKKPTICRAYLVVKKFWFLFTFNNVQHCKMGCLHLHFHHIGPLILLFARVLACRIFFSKSCTAFSALRTRFQSRRFMALTMLEPATSPNCSITLILDRQPSL